MGVMDGAGNQDFPKTLFLCEARNLMILPSMPKLKFTNENN